ncbi:LmbE family N-acetylglucosaminyl deacetylase [Streptomyces tendae]|uniref:PIG-L deacetylase family protein n=1 Tax=Streptomyces tendae TaxID=1932 RepID=UPI003834AAE0
MTSQLTSFPDDWTTALCVVAHPDDIEFGGSGAVATWTAAGKSVGYLLLTRGEAGIDGLAPEECAKVREAEQRAGAEAVGVTSVEFLDHPDGTLTYGTGLRRDIAAAIRRARPQLVVGYNHRDTTSTAKWNTADHRAAGRALLDAVGDAGNRWIFPDPDAEPWAGVRYVAMMASPEPTHAVDVSDGVEAAVASMEAHRTYLAGLGFTGDVRAPVTGQYAQTGERFGGVPAVAFELVGR